MLWRLFAWCSNIRDGQEAASFGRGLRLCSSKCRLKSCANLVGDLCASSDHRVQIVGRDFRCTSGMLLMAMGGGAALLPLDFLWVF